MANQPPAQIKETILDRKKANFLPKYYQLKQILLKKIHNNEFPASESLPSERFLMREYAVSRATVRESINELIQEGILTSIQGKGTFITDIKHHGTMSAGQKKTDIPVLPSERRVALILGNSIEEFHSNILRGVLDALQEKETKVDIYNSDKLYLKESQLLGKSLQEHVSGVLMFPSHYNKHYRHMIKLQKAKIPVVLIDRYVRDMDLDFVGSDNIKGAELAVEHLIKLGHKRIALVGKNKTDVSSQVDRITGYKQTLAKYNIQYDPGLVTNGGDGLEGDGFEQTNKLMAKFKFGKSGTNPVTAVFALNDHVAIGVFHALKQKGIKVPDDVALVGFDNLSVSRYLEVPLTTVEQQIYDMGRKGAELLLIRMNNQQKNISPEKVLLPVKLVVRNSCGTKLKR
jgi:DNA-binding LacI/PurR family transcriptional regulator